MPIALSSNFTSGDWTWEICENLASAETIWRKFEQEAACHWFQTFDWLSRWVEIVGKPVHSIEPCTILAKKQGELLFILPLGIRREKCFRILEWLGGIHADYQGPLVKKGFGPGSLTEIWVLITKTLPKFDAIFFSKQPAVIVTESNPFVTSAAIEQTRAYSILMKQTWEQYQLERVNPKLRADSRRQRKRLGELGNLKFVVASDPQTAKRLTQIMFDQKRRRYRATGHWDMLAVKEYRQFFEKMTDDLLENKVIHVSALEINDTVIATHWGALYRNYFYYLMPSIEGGKWDRYSPGRLLLEHLLEWCFNNGVEEFDFTGGAEGYKLDWYNHDMPLYYFTETNTLKGQIYRQWHNKNKSLKEIVKASAIGPLARNVYNRLKNGVSP